MSVKLGLDAKIYFCAAGIGGTPTWTELTNVKNVTLNLQKGEADVTTRANSGWKGIAPTLRECTATFSMVWKPGDAGFDKIKSAYLSGEAVEGAFLSGDREDSGSEGPRASWSVTGFDRNEELEQAITVDVTMKISTFREWVDVVTA